MPVPTADFLAGMRRLAAGVSIVTTAAGEVRAGLTATAVCSLTAEPPRLIACVQRNAEAHDLILRRRGFAVNLLTVTHQALSDRFGGRTEAFGSERFALGAWTTGRTGLPILADAAASFECRLVEAVAAGTHSIFIGEVEVVAFGSEAPRLIYEAHAYGRMIPLEV